MIDDIVQKCLEEDLGEGDHSSLACVPENATGKAKLIVKEEGVLAGVELAELIFKQYDSSLKFTKYIDDGSQVAYGDIAFEIEGKSRSILATERLVLNFMQRMSGIASKTHRIVVLIKSTEANLLDTRKTTPGIRLMEKWAVRIGGGQNHRHGLYDMIMLKDNHIDYAGGVEQAIVSTKKYLDENGKDLKIEIEVRSMEELKKVLRSPSVDPVMLQNFRPEQIVEALKIIPEEMETEASGGINEDTILAYAQTGVNYISMGALTHSVDSLDMSLKATFE